MPLDSSIASKLLRPSNKTKFHCSSRLVGNYFDILLVQFRDVRKCYVHNGTCVYVYFSVHGILQARILQWVAIFFSRRSSDPEIETASPDFGT